MRPFVFAALLGSAACISGPAPAPSNPAPLTLRDPTSLPALHCGRAGSKPVDVRVDGLGKNHLALTLIYPSLGQQFKYEVEEVRLLENGKKALAGHKLANNDGKDAWVDPTGSFVFFSGTPPRKDDLNATYQFVDKTPEQHLDLDTDVETSSPRRAMSVYLRCENLDAFIDAVAAG